MRDYLKEPICNKCERPISVCPCQKDRGRETASFYILNAVRWLGKLTGERAIQRQKELDQIFADFPNGTPSGQFVPEDSTGDTKLVEVAVMKPDSAFAVDYRTVLGLSDYLLRYVEVFQKGEPHHVQIMRQAAEVLSGLREEMLEEKDGREKIVKIVTEARNILETAIN